MLALQSSPPAIIEALLDSVNIVRSASKRAEDGK
jgi:hypothetical protein